MGSPNTKFNSRTHQLRGMRFGRWTVLDYVTNGHWRCQCDCGTIKSVKANNLLADGPRGSKSCGCLKRELASKRHTHWQSHTKLYKVWAAMVGRCECKTNKAYHHYGGRGIFVCDRWLGRGGFENFTSDMGPPDLVNREIDRIDNDGPYSPENCRWASRTTQTRNSRQARMLPYRNETRCLSEWCELLDIPYGRTKHRLHRGWSIADSFEKPHGYKIRQPSK